MPSTEIINKLLPIVTFFNSLEKLCSYIYLLFLPGDIETLEKFKLSSQQSNKIEKC